MRRSLGFGLILLALSVGVAQAQEKINYGTAIKFSPVYYLPVLAAQEKGYFQKNGLDVTWVPSQSGPDMQRDLATGAVQIGSSNAGTDIPAIAKGVPAIIVANLQPTDDFAVWVATNSRFQKPADLKGAKIGVSRLGGAEHAYGRLVARGLGLEKDIQFVSTGGVRESVAVLTTGGIDGVVLSPNQMMDLMLQGRVKSLVPLSAYQKKPWLSYTVVANKSFVAKEPGTVKKILASLWDADRFVLSADGRPWALAKLKEVSHYSDAAAERLYALLNLSTDGKFQKQAVENVVDFMVDYDLLKKGDVKSVDTLYTDQFVR
ncbi:MAG TPA: ABC transporter substrate-binding protein [Stellaceae bacterium]|nr:ABC transporter substrate-binding protein [Stellaceae bacterium]